MTEDLFFAPVTERNQRLKKKEFSAVELTRAFAERLEKTGPRFNALALHEEASRIAEAGGHARKLEVESGEQSQELARVRRELEDLKVKAAAAPGAAKAGNVSSREFLDLREALDHGSRAPMTVKAGDVVVVRHEGPKGGPGMQEMLAPTTAIKAVGLDEKCALITDGRFSGGTAGASIGHVSPEAAVGGPIGLLKDGDLIAIDIMAGKLEVKLTEAELAERKTHWQPPAPRVTKGYLARYARMATSADTGGVLKWD